MLFLEVSFLQITRPVIKSFPSSYFGFYHMLSAKFLLVVKEWITCTFGPDLFTTNSIEITESQVIAGQIFANGKVWVPFIHTFIVIKQFKQTDITFLTYHRVAFKVCPNERWKLQQSKVAGQKDVSKNLWNNEGGTLSFSIFDIDLESAFPLLSLLFMLVIGSWHKKENNI